MSDTLSLRCQEYVGNKVNTEQNMLAEQQAKQSCAIARKTRAMAQLYIVKLTTWRHN